MNVARGTVKVLETRWKVYLEKETIDTVGQVADVCKQ